MLQPKRTRYRKAHKGRIRGNSKGGTSLNFGTYGLKAVEPERLTGRPQVPNEDVGQFAREHSDHIMAFASVDPTRGKEGVTEAERLIKTFSTEGDLVLDPFCGSGQTLLAAKGCGRRYMGMEREDRSVKIALGRLER